MLTRYIKGRFPRPGKMKILPARKVLPKKRLTGFDNRNVMMWKADNFNGKN